MLEPLVNLLPDIPGGSLGLVIVLAGILAVIFSAIAKIILKAASYVAGKTKTELDDEILEKVRNPFYIIAIITAIYLSISFVYGDTLKFDRYTILDFYIVLVLILTMVAVVRVSDIIFQWYGREIAPKTKTTIDEEFLPLGRKIAKAIIYLFFGILILGQLGIEVSALIATLGIAGLAVALALQDSLSNFFAGIYILADKPLKEGDYVSIDGKIEGTIVQIGWRSTKIRTLSNNYIIIPNNKIAQSTIINYELPEQKLSQILSVGVSYEADPDKVIETIREAVKKASEEFEGIAKDYEPIVRMDAFEDFAIKYKIIYRVNRYVDQYRAKGLILRNIYDLFKKKGIVIPYPITTVYLHEEKKGKKK